MPVNLFNLSQVGLTIPKRCSGNVAITFKHGSVILGTAGYRVIVVEGNPEIKGFRFYPAQRWVYVQGENFKQGALVIVSERYTSIKIRVPSLYSLT